MVAAEIPAALARTLQSLRAERGWSLDQLAARSGVSKGVLVSVEQARSNPNLATLARVGDAFGLPVTRLLDVPPEPSVRITGPEDARTLWHGTAGRVVRRRPALARDQGAGLGRGGHPDADRGRGAAPGLPRPVRPLARGPAAFLRQRGDRAGPPHHGGGRAPGPGVSGLPVTAPGDARRARWRAGPSLSGTAPRACADLSRRGPAARSGWSRQLTAACVPAGRTGRAPAAGAAPPPCRPAREPAWPDSAPPATGRARRGPHRGRSRPPRRGRWPRRTPPRPASP